MNALNLPRPEWMTEDLVLLEEQARRYIADEFVPHIDRWHEAGIYDRDVWTKAGEAGLLCASMPEEYGGAGGTFAHEAVINREFALAGLRHIRRAAPLGHRRALHFALRHRRAEETMAAETCHRRTRWRDRDDRAGHRLRSAGRARVGEEIGQRLCAQRFEDIHHQWPARQPDRRCRKNRSESRREGHLAFCGRDRRRARLSPRAQAEKARHGFGRHLRAVFRGRATAGIEPARHRGRARLLIS